MRAFKKLIYGIVLKGETSDPTDNIEGSIWHNSTSSKFKSYIGGAVRELATADQSQVLINKTIDADLNTITNIDNNEIKAGAAIDRSKLASGNGYVLVINDVAGAMAEADSIPADFALVSDANGIPIASTVTTTELEQLSGLSGTIVTTSGTQTLSNKTLDNSNIITVQDSNLTIQDNADNTKQAQFQLSGITTGTTRTYTLPDASATLIDTTSTQTMSNKTLTSPTIATINGVDAINGAAATLDILAAASQNVNIQGGSGQSVVVEGITVTDNLISGAGGVLTELRSTAANLYLNAGGNLNIDSSAQISVTAGSGGNSKVAITGGLSVSKVVQNLRADDSTSSGTADLSTPVVSYLRVTNAGLSTLRSIGAGADGQKLTLTNDTGVSLTVKNEDTGATAANRILTGTEADFTFGINATIELIYDTADSRWRIASSSAGSSTSDFTQNFAQNGEFRFYQRQTPGSITNRQDDQYGPDRWYVLTSGGATNVGVARGTDSPSASVTTYCGQFRQGDATARQFGTAQILESTDCINLRGKQVTFSTYARTDSTEITTLRMGIVEWSGTADSVTSDVVSSWGSTPTLVASATFANTPSDLTISSAWAPITVTATLSSSFTNLVLFVWTPNTEAQNDDFYLTQVQLVKASAPVAWDKISKSFVKDLEECERFYEKSYQLDTVPGTSTDTGSTIIGIANGSSTCISTVRWKTRKRNGPTVTFYSSSGTANQLANFITAVAVSLTSYTESSESALFYCSSSGAFTSAVAYYGQYTVESEL